ncbi:MAG: hypothetical protein ACO1PZ_05535 [Gammaproteobacteria bacterium]
MKPANSLAASTRAAVTLRCAIAALIVPAALSLAACARNDAPQTPQAQPVDQPQQTAASTVPDFSGVWMAIGVENPDGEGTAPRYSMEGQQRLDAFVAQYTEIPEAGAACVGSGMPGVMLSLVSYPIEFVQNDSRILMVAELETQIRRVFIDGRARSDEVFPSNTGYSLGTWDGDTLVVETNRFEEWPLPPWPRSADAEIVERMHLTTMDQVDVQRSGFIAGVRPPLNDDVLVVDITITDPAYYDGPQRRIAYYQRMPDEATSEYACSQGLWYDALDKLRVAD